ncbi:hypothetical protein D3C83_197350 [compost metagenome]
MPIAKNKIDRAMHMVANPQCPSNCHETTAAAIKPTGINSALRAIGDPASEGV